MNIAVPYLSTWSLANKHDSECTLKTNKEPEWSEEAACPMGLLGCVVALPLLLPLSHSPSSLEAQHYSC